MLLKSSFATGQSRNHSGLGNDGDDDSDDGPVEGFSLDGLGEEYVFSRARDTCRHISLATHCDYKVPMQYDTIIGPHIHIHP